MPDLLALLVQLTQQMMKAKLMLSNELSCTVLEVKVVEGLGCKAIRVFDPEQIQESIQAARKLTNEVGVPVVVEVITERVTDIAMGPEIDKITEFEEIVDVEEGEAFLEQLAA